MKRLGNAAVNTDVSHIHAHTCRPSTRDPLLPFFPPAAPPPYTHTPQTPPSSFLLLPPLPPSLPPPPQSAYTRSSAAACMAGYLLGLGDRHSGNILLHGATGEVVHIDLGIAFEQVGGEGEGGGGEDGEGG